MGKIYRYGDIVVMVGKPHLGEAAIVARNDCGLYALEFAHPNAELHSCGGLTDDHCGCWARPAEIELLQAVDEPMRYRLNGDPEETEDTEFSVDVDMECEEEDMEEEPDPVRPAWSMMLSCRDGQVHGMFEHEEMGPAFHGALSSGYVLEDVARAVLAMLEARGN